MRLVQLPRQPVGQLVPHLHFGVLGSARPFALERVQPVQRVAHVFCHGFVGGGGALEVSPLLGQPFAPHWSSGRAARQASWQRGSGDPPQRLELPGGGHPRLQLRGYAPARRTGRAGASPGAVSSAARPRPPEFHTLRQILVPVGHLHHELSAQGPAGGLPAGFVLALRA